MLTDHKTKIAPQLAPGENLLWYGQPKQGIIFRAADLYFVFMLLFVGFWFYGVSTSNAPTFFLLFAIPGGLYAIFMNTGRYFLDARQRANTFYGVTNERVIIVWGIFNQKVKTLPLKTLYDLSLNERTDGTGTITFGPEMPSKSWIEKMFSKDEDIVYPDFTRIPQARKVYEIIREAQARLLK